MAKVNIELRRFCSDFILAQCSNSVPMDELPALFDDAFRRFEKFFVNFDTKLPLPEALTAMDLRQFVAKLVLCKANERIMGIDEAVRIFETALAEFGPRFSMELSMIDMAQMTEQVIGSPEPVVDLGGGYRTIKAYNKYYSPLPLDYEAITVLQREAIAYDFGDSDEDGVLIRYWDKRMPEERAKAFKLGFSSIQEESILCLECPTKKPYKSLYVSHLRKHHLYPLAYRQKYGIDLGTPLSRFARLSMTKQAKDGHVVDGAILMRQNQFLIDNFIDTRTSIQRYMDFKRGREAVSEFAIKCLLCGKEFNLLDREHLLHAHGITPEEYKLIFGYQEDFYLQGRVNAERAKQMSIGDSRPGGNQANNA